MIEYFTSPYDVLFFRDNKSFHFGKWFSEGIFPPYPSTFQGFVRSKILDDEGLIGADGRVPNGERSKAENAVGTDTELTIDIAGPFLAEKKSASARGIRNLFFPSPRDLIKAGATYRSACYRINECEEFETDLDFAVAPLKNVPNEKPEKLSPPPFVSMDELMHYRTTLADLRLSGNEFFIEEDRVGIGLQSEARVVEEKRFYVTPYNRMPEDFGFYFSVDQADAASNVKMPNEGTHKLGSEAHAAHIETLGKGGKTFIEDRLQRTRAELTNTMKRTRTFRLLLLQPGVFESGWLPFPREKNNSKKMMLTAPLGTQTVKLQLLFAFTDAPLTISGYSYAANRDGGEQDSVKIKRTVKAVPAGSVYLFKFDENCSDGDIDNFIHSVDNKKIPYLHYSNMGFNHVMLACGPELKQHHK
jgi:CRISPR type III-B/RAMP module-associated protein Cmr3